jgi:hypothetical protein
LSALAKRGFFDLSALRAPSKQNEALREILSLVRSLLASAKKDHP